MKKAFTLIELVISIVIIAIASVTLPMMLGSANKLQEQTINQDVFFKSITVMTDILSRPWDNATGASINDGQLALIWNVNNAAKDSTLINTTNGRYRYGSVQADNYRYFYENYLNATAITSTAGQLTNTTSIDSINDYSGKNISESLSDGANVDYSIGVRYVPDVVDDPTAKRQKTTWQLGSGTTYTLWADSTNLKRINIKATRNIGSETMSADFVYFSSNIGTPGIKTK